MFRLLVTGARIWDDVWTIEHYLDTVYDNHPDLVIIHGDCPRGADRIARDWAEENNVPEERYPADWDKYGKPAGHIRNKQMVDTKPHLAASFVRGESRGTNNCISHIERAGIPHARFRQPE